jgi:hypothetical protein
MAMHKLLIAGAALLALCGQGHAHNLPDTVTGDWCETSHGDNWFKYRRGRCDNPLHIYQDHYDQGGFECPFTEVKRVTNSRYVITGRCVECDSPYPIHIEVSHQKMKFTFIPPRELEDKTK